MQVAFASSIVRRSTLSQYDSLHRSEIVQCDAGLSRYTIEVGLTGMLIPTCKRERDYRSVDKGEIDPRYFRQYKQDWEP